MTNWIETHWSLVFTLTLVLSNNACKADSAAREPASPGDAASAHDADPTVDHDGATDAQDRDGELADIESGTSTGSDASSPSTDAGDSDGSDGTQRDAEVVDAADAADAADAGVYYPSAENRSGERLKAHFIEASDGARIANGWHDSLLETPCRFAAASDGLVRCVPAGEKVAFAASYFSDPDCTIPVASVALDACVTPQWMQTYDTTTCPARISFYEIGARITSEAGFQRDAVTQACVPTTFQLAGAAYYEAGAFVDPAQFATGEAHFDATLGRVLVREFTTDDGAHAFLGFVDSAMNANCSFGRTFDGVTRCLPEARASVETTRFSDEACSLWVATESKSTATCTAPRFASERKLVDCISHTRIYETGSALSSVYAQNDTSCVQSESPPTLNDFQLGSVLEDDVFVEASFERPTSGPPSARLIPGRYRLLGGVFRSNAQLFDTVRNENCSFAIAGDGKLRCLPSSSASEFFYRDAQCTEPVLDVRSFEGCERTEAPTIARVYDRTSCPTRVRVIEVGDEVELDPVYILFIDGRCLSMSHPSGRFFLEGDEIPPDAFMDAEDVVAP
ncbi:MAG: hypothetical protein IPK13_04965 [Deltaproteobacteria bacterium]|nr:hypothetical protein [Deltaproteobacteria bacterium]